MPAAHAGCTRGRVGSDLRALFGEQLAHSIVHEPNPLFDRLLLMLDREPMPLEKRSSSNAHIGSEARRVKRPCLPGDLFEKSARNSLSLVMRVYKHHVDVPMFIDIGEPNNLTICGGDKTIPPAHGAVPLHGVALARLGPGLNLLLRVVSRSGRCDRRSKNPQCGDSVVSLVRADAAVLRSRTHSASDYLDLRGAGLRSCPPAPDLPGSVSSRAPEPRAPRMPAVHAGCTRGRAGWAASMLEPSCAKQVHISDGRYSEEYRSM